MFPTQWDARQIPACRALAGRYELVRAGPASADVHARFDLLAFLDETARAHAGAIDGVLSSCDYPGAPAAAALASRLGLPGAHPRAVITASHKWACRRVQRAAVPDATPDFALVDPRRADGGLDPRSFPWFVKPVKGAFSMLARRIDDAAALGAYLRDPATQCYLDEYALMFDALVGAFTDLEHGGRWFVAERILNGPQVTVEGYLAGDEPVLLGVVDSIVDPATGSFVRFDYPSALDAAVQQRMVEVAFAAVAALGLRDTLFNVELVLDAPSGRPMILEVNPRMCGQFADLYEKVDGVNGYEVALALASGTRPPRPVREGRFPCAASVPLRVFEPVRVTQAPDARALREVEAAFPGVLAWSECEAGQELADFALLEDGHSARYAIVNLGGRDRDDLGRTLHAVRARLSFAFEPLDAAAPAAEPPVPAPAAPRVARA